MTSAEESTSHLARATFDIVEADLELMVLDRSQLPPDVASFEVAREGLLDNAAMVEHGFPGNTESSFWELGRLSGYIREFANPAATEVVEGMDLAAATVTHLFKDGEGVSRWMRDVFLRQFEENVGKPMRDGIELLKVKRLDVTGFFDETVGVWALQAGPVGLVSSTVIDFRVGRLLGVGYERHIVRVALG
jgi:hypothetical protein